MPNLKVKICDIEFKNPVIAASGTFGFGREYGELYDISLLGGISTKGLTLKRRIGNDSPRIAETASGMLNSVGLQNVGVDTFIENELSYMREHNTVILANIAGNTELEYCEMAWKLSNAEVDMIELNISCPNVKEGGISFGREAETVRKITEQVKNHCLLPLVVKLSPNVASIADVAKGAEDGGADAISLINTLTGMAINAKTRRPILANVTGGLSGPCIKPVALRMVYEAAKAVKIPVIGMGGIMTGEDAAEFMIAGASAVQVGTANISDPFACKRIIEELEGFLIKNNIKDVNELIGTLTI